MKPDERDLAMLQTILLIIGRIRDHLSRTTADRFVGNDDDIDLLSYRLAMIGGYTQKLSESLRSRHPDMPWRSMIGLRNIIAHEYRRAAPARLWDTATHHLDELERLCQEEAEAMKS